MHQPRCQSILEDEVPSPLLPSFCGHNSLHTSTSWRKAMLPYNIVQSPCIRVIVKFPGVRQYVDLTVEYDAQPATKGRLQITEVTSILASAPDTLLFLEFSPQGS
jgi:hypothetical protein